MRNALVVALSACLFVTTGCSDDDPAETNAASGSASGSGGSGSGGTGATGSAGGAGGDAGGAGGSGGQGGQPTLEPGWYEAAPPLNNDAACELPTVVYPVEGEAGHLYGVRLVPPSYPYAVTGIHYELVGEGYCDITTDHRVEIFVSQNVAPPNEPDLLANIDVPGAATDGDYRVVKLDLDEEIVLEAGDFLFVAVELPLVEASCIAACQDAPVDDRDYWSNAAAMPYDWATLGSFGFHDHARIGAVGAPR